MSATSETTTSDSVGSQACISADADAFYIRFYLWLYEADENRINTCKLFWAYLLAPLVLVLKYVFWRPAQWVGDKLDAQAAKRHKSRPYIYTPPKEKKPSKADALLDKVSGRASFLYAKFATLIRWLVVGLLVVLAIAAVVFIIYAVIQNPVGVLATFGVIVGIFLGALLFVLIFDKVLLGSAGQRFFGFFGKLFHSFHNHTCAIVELNKDDSAT